jgi:hypothetical protein
LGSDVTAALQLVQRGASHYGSLPSADIVLFISLLMRFTE